MGTPRRASRSFTPTEISKRRLARTGRLRFKMICFACKSKIEHGNLLRCTGCKSGYHYSCLNITSATFREQSVTLKSTYKCDSCANVTQRVRVSDETPVRGTATKIGSETMEKPDASCEDIFFKGNITSSPVINNMESFMDVMKEVISARLSAFESKLIQEIKNSVTTLTLENSKLREELTVANNKCRCLEQEINVLKTEKRNTLQQRSSCIENPTSDIISKSIDIQGSAVPSGPAPRPPPTSSHAVAVAERAGGEQPPRPPRPPPPPASPSISYAAVTRNTANMVTVESKWIDVKSVKRNNPVKKGGNTSVALLKAVERKKFLHVWRLDKSTTEETLRGYIENVLGSDCDIIIQKLRPKTERDYASFKIGTTEGNFNKLCNPDIWPVHVEFSEWIWFRRPAAADQIQSTNK